MVAPLNLTGKVALVTGVADDVGFAWHIAKALQAAGADVILLSHPRVCSIVERFLARDKSKESRELPFGVAGEFKPKALIGCDVACDTAADIDPAMKGEKGYDFDVSIEGAFARVKDIAPAVDIVIHSVAFSPEIAKSLPDVSRKAYLMAQSVSAYSLTALCRAAAPLMKGRGGSVVGLSYMASERAVPFYGGGMSSAKASLESDSRLLAWFLGGEGHRVNIVSAGPYASRAAKSIGDIGAMIDNTAQRSPLRRAIDADDVANAVLFLCSDLSRNITGTTVYVDAGYHAMGT
ncbi:MAG: SDR family oxidoreductase [Deltaproteobacteria bacterium]|nr:SDR family oxidoreductase [Deltaproteobacteria bacterium]